MLTTGLLTQSEDDLQFESLKSRRIMPFGMEDLKMVEEPDDEMGIKFEKLNTVGILPFELGNARIIESYQIFLHYIDIDLIKNETTQLIDDFHAFTNIIKSKNILNLEQLKSQQQLLDTLVEGMKEKFNSIWPQNRIKRGIYDKIGTLVKSITGNLDAEDGKRFEEAIKKLEKNQTDLAANTKQQIMLNTNLINELKNKISNVEKNENKLQIDISEVKRKLIHIIDDEKYNYLKNILEQFSYSITILTNMLDDVKTAIDFSLINIAHGSIVKSENLFYMLNETKKSHPSMRNRFAFNEKNIYEYYKLMKVQLYHVGDRLIFAVHFPIILNSIYKYYKLYSVPNDGNEIIIPPASYLALGFHKYQYDNEECKKIAEMYICKAKNLLATRDDCIIDLIKSRKESTDICRTSHVDVVRNIVEQVSEAHFILMIMKPTKIFKGCQGLYAPKTIEGNYLVTLPENCGIVTDEVTYENKKQIVDVKPVILPRINFDTIDNITKSSLNNPLQLKNIDLTELIRIQEQLEHIDIVALRPFNESKIQMDRISTFLIIIGITVIIIIIVLASLNILAIWRKKVNLVSARAYAQELIPIANKN